MVILTLFSDAQLLDQATVALQIVLLQVVEQAAAAADQLHQSAVRCEIFFVLLKVAGDLADALSKHCNLAFNAAGVCCRSTIGGKYAGFLFFRD